MKTYAPYSRFEARRDGMIQLCESINPEYLVTLRFNNHRAHNLDRAETVLKRFDAALDRKLLGPDWAGFRDELRTRFIAIPEGHSSGNPYTRWALHYHLLLTPPSSSRIVLNEHVLQSVTTPIWRKYAACDDVDVRPTWAVGGAASYLTKRLDAPNSLGFDRLVIGPMSAPRKQ